MSVSAQLASGLIALGIHPRLTGQLAAWVRAQGDPRGGWADDFGDRDLITTLAGADLLAGLDPGWDPADTVRWIDSCRRRDRAFIACDPEVAWLTLELDGLLESLGLPFPDRFRWPHVAVEQRDRRTALPFLAYLADLDRLFAEVPALAASSVEIAFLDLAGFGEWNNRFGMAVGDRVLRFLADELRTIPGCVAIRDGGDEFLVVGAPGRTGLRDALDRFRRGFPARFKAHFGNGLAPVATRIVAAAAAGGQLIAARDRLGIEIGALKAAMREPGPEGVMRWLG